MQTETEYLEEALRETQREDGFVVEGRSSAGALGGQLVADVEGANLQRIPGETA